MANPNTKIIIQEHDATAPRGAGVSSDVVYVPGLARLYVEDSKGVAVKYYEDTLTAAGFSTAELESGEVGYVKQGSDSEGTYYFKKTPRNTPVLCYTVDEFEAAFGALPYVMTAEDVAEGVYAHTYSENGLDRSYIYAKELLQAGLTVYYENISPDESTPVNITRVYIDETLSNDSDLTAGAANKFVYHACQDRTTAQTYHFAFKLPDLTGQTDDDDPTKGVGAHLIVNYKDIENLTVTITNCTAVTSGGSTAGQFTVDPKTDGMDITWNKDLVTADFNDVTFKFDIIYHYQGTEYGVDCDTVIGVVKGTASDATDVTFGRIQYLYENIKEAFLTLEDKNEFTVKYITSGGYPVFDIGVEGIYTTMLSVAGTRGDAVALIDHLDRPEAPHGANQSGSIFDKVNTYLASDANASYGAMFTPWGKYSFATVTDSIDHPSFMPGSFGYMLCMAKAIKSSPNWLAMAGVTRGMVPNLQSLHVDKYISNVTAEDYQPKFGTGKNVSINCITNIKPYGLCIWGNRTLLPVDPKGTKATNGLNTRNMTSDIKKVAYDTAKKLMFEQDSEILWTRFKAGVSGFLDQLKSGFGISDYKIIRTTKKYFGEALTRGELAATIKIFPISAIEYFEITVVLADEDVQVS